MKVNNKIHFAWFILAGCCLINCGVSGIINAVGLFFSPVSLDLGISITQISSTRTVQSLISSGFMFFFAGKLLRGKYKKTLIIVSVIHSVCWLLMSKANYLWQLYLYQALMGASVAILQSLAITTTINNWFIKKRGFAYSVSAAFSGISGIIISKITGNIISSSGWRNGYLFFAIISFVFTMISALFIMQKKPADMGLLPYGADENYVPDENISQKRHATKDVYSNLRLYVLLFLYASFNFATTSTVHTSNYASSIGFSIIEAASISSIGLAGNVFGKLFVGTLRDKIGSTKAAISWLTLVIIGFGLLITNPDTIRLYIGVFLVGSAMCLPTVISPVLTGDFFTGEDYLDVLPIVSTAGSLIGACGNYIYGLTFDLTGGYTFAFKVCIILLCASIVIIYLNSIRGKVKNG